jgi:benzoate membrane transport protein
LSDAAGYRRRRLSDVSGSAIGAGFLAVLVSYAGPLLIYLSASEAMGIDKEGFSSWVFAISVAAGVSSIGLSLWFRVPVAMAWSAPGTVLLISLGTSLSPAEMVGAYLAVAAVLVLIGVSGVFERLVKLLPPSVTNGMMAGILFGFGLKAAGGLATDPAAIAMLILVFAICAAVVPRYAMLALLALLASALLVSAAFYDASVGTVGVAFAKLEITGPAFSTGAMLSLALPLLITTLSGQYLPGMAILGANGFQNSANPILIIGGLVSVAAAFLGGITTALASITAAFCAGPDSHEDPERRYIAGIACGVFFCLGGVFSGSIVETLVLLPSAVIALLAGLALLQPILKFTSSMLASDDAQAGLLTFMFTASGVSLFGIGSAFWGVVIGIVVHFLGRTAASLSGGTNT